MKNNSTTARPFLVPDKTTINVVSQNAGPWLGSSKLLSDNAPKSISHVLDSSPKLDSIFANRNDPIHEGPIYVPSLDAINFYLPHQVLRPATYRFGPSTGRVSIVEDSIAQPNGNGMSPDGCTMYISDTSVTDFSNYPADGPLSRYNYDPLGGKSLYAFDIVSSLMGSYIINERPTYLAQPFGDDGFHVAQNGSAADISSSREESTDDSSDESDSSNQQITRVRTLGSSAAAEEQSQPGATQTLDQASRSSSYHRDLLLHALLEERCYNEALEDLRNSGINVDRSHPQVDTLAKEKYARLSQQLGRYGLETGDLDSEQFGPLRQTYRDGLSVITRKSVDLQTPIEEILAQSQGSNLPGPLLRLMGGNEPSATIDMSRRFSDLAIAGSDLHAQPKLLGNGILPGHPLLNSTRYTRDFEEFGILGKGGYGTVFRCKHNLDGRHYAIKKIPLGPSRMRKIQENGQAELDHILVEVRTLARLEHPNIVRYHSGWIEWAPLISNKQALESNAHKLLEAPQESEEDGIDTFQGNDGRADVPAIDVQFGYDDDEDPFEIRFNQGHTLKATPSKRYQVEAQSLPSATKAKSK
ncbi:kinase-like protein [Aureobasidium subglaciale]|nr:kinase-like protein [Aureobasidium subglaciale]